MKKDFCQYSIICCIEIKIFFPGGETIKQINQQSGAHVELQRQPPENPNEKIFNIRGQPSQIQHAISLIAEKAGLPYVSKRWFVLEKKM